MTHMSGQTSSHGANGNQLTPVPYWRILVFAKGMELPATARLADGSCGVEHAVGAFFLAHMENNAER
jgi:hypothetical protein